ncbi:sulfatase-like hydrolase/transferase [bacterium]|nr:sulfatase-like hydrolase/transferase [bacterium]
MKHFHLSIFLLVSATFAVRSTAAPSTSSGEVLRPNFIVILTDDQGWGTTSVAYDPKVPDSKSDFHRTPNIERLAAAGMRFTQGYSAHPNCSPSRAALLTGRSPAALHFTDICNRNSGGLYEGNRLLPPQHINALPEEEQTIPELLKATHPEYTAAHFGKWHLKGGGPEAHGFDAGDGSTGNAEGGKKDNLPNDPKRCFSITERAIDWMKEQANADKPFYLQVSHYATHLPLQARPESLARFESATPGTRHDNVPFAAMIADMDESIGQLLDALAASGVADNTYVIFTSDNGTFPIESPGNINGPLRGSKATIWEAGVRVPFIVTGPGIESNSISRQPAIGYDILPTICELAGIETWPEAVEGGSLIPALYQKGDISRSCDALHFHWPHYQHEKKSKPDSTIITGDYKLHYWWETGDIQLFNLSKDLAETTDLAKSQSEKAASLKKELFSYLEDIDAQLPVANDDYDPATDPARLKGANRKKKKTNTSTTVKMNPIYEEVHPAPDIAGGSLQIVVEATQRSAVADGVLLAHGGNVAGYSLHVEQGIPVFEVSRKKEIFRIAWPEPVKGKMRIVAELGDKKMSLSVNGAPKVSAASPGLFRAQPKIGLSVGYDARSNAGSYEVPNPYNGTILSTRIDAGGTPPAVAKVMPRSEIEAGLASHDQALFIKEGWIRDPYIILGPDDYYYLTGTTPNPGDSREQSDPYNTGLGNESIVGWKAKVWRSKDLIDWEPLGTPFTLKEGIWFEKRPKRFKDVPEKLWFLWAPEVHWLGDRWALTHTSPSPVRGANLAFTEGADLKGPWTHPMGAKIGHRHDPSLFKDDGTWYLLYGNTQVVPLNADFSLTTAEPVQIDPSGSRTTPAGDTLSVIGHEGATMRKIGDKYVHIGTAWSTDTGRKGSYNLYYCTADKITGPYGPRKFAGRFLGHGTPFQDKQGRWWCTAFYNGNIPPVERKGIETRDLGATAQTINQRGVTIVPLDVKVLEDGEIYIRAKDSAYANPGPDEVQQFAK